MGRVGGKIFVATNGSRVKAKGSFTWNLGADKREMIVGSDEVHGHKEMPQTPYLEGMVTVDSQTDIRGLVEGEDLTVTCELASGQTFVLREAVFAGDGAGTTEEGELPVRWEGRVADMSSS